MDDLEFRRQAYADPKDSSEAFLNAAKGSRNNQKFVEELKAFDSQLEQALKVEPPEGLADRILLNQSFEEYQGNKRHNLVQLAMAASVAFAIGLSVSLVNFERTPSMGDVAIAHVKNEVMFSRVIDERADLNAVNAKLAKYGGKLENGIGHIYYVNHCTFHGSPAFHMVMQGEAGKVTVFIVPSSTKLSTSPLFSDGQLTGMVTPVNNANLVIIGEQKESLEKIERKLDRNINWSI